MPPATFFKSNSSASSGSAARCRFTPKAFAPWIAIPALLAACTDLRPISACPPGSYGASAPRSLVVEQPYTRRRLATSYYPAGRYTAQFVDSQGTFYVAPTKVISNAFGLVDGGIYVPFGRPSLISAYMIDDDYENDSHTPVKLVNGVPGLAYHFER